MAKKAKRKGYWEKVAHKKIGVSGAIQQGEELFILSENEVEQLKKIRFQTYVKAGVAGTLGVLLLYIPYHLFEEALFPVSHVWLPVYEGYIDVEVSFLIYSVVLVLFEIWYLTYLNIKTVSSISRLCGHPNPTDENYENNLNALISVGIEKKQKQLESIGINPYQGLSKIGVTLFQMMLKLKAAVSNMLFRILVKKMLGRYALRFVLDFAGIPVYAFWNIWGAGKVMKESRIRVMAPPLIKKLANDIFLEQKENKEFVESLYDTLQLISESKRSFHYNHFLLSITMLDKFGVEINEELVYNDDFIEEIPDYSDLTKKGIEQLFVFGIMIDGKVSLREKKAVRYLVEKKVLSCSENDVIQWSKDYYNGKGIESFFKL
jgi:hypothetical protein